MPSQSVVVSSPSVDCSFRIVGCCERRVGNRGESSKCVGIEGMCSNTARTAKVSIANRQHDWLIGRLDCSRRDRIEIDTSNRLVWRLRGKSKLVVEK